MRLRTRIRLGTKALVAIGLVTTWWAAGIIAGSAADASPNDTTLSSCAFSDLQHAVKLGGLVSYSVDCPDIVFTSTISVKNGLAVDIEGNGHTVAFDGSNKVRLFIVSGEH